MIMKIMKNKKVIIIFILVLIFSLYVFLFNMKPSTIEAGSLIPFSKDDFIDAETLENENVLVGSNANFELHFDETTSYFSVVDKTSGEVWMSNPTEKDPWELDPEFPITNTALDKQKSTLELSYFNKAGSKTTINNYPFSIYHPKNILFSAGKRTYSVKYLDNAVQVLYVIEDLEIDYLHFPKFLPKEVFEALEDREVLETLAYTGFDEDRQLYEIVQYEDMSRLVKKRLYKIFYEEPELEEDKYSRERAIAENASYGFTEQYEKVRFEIGVEIKLTDTGIETSIINDSIVEPSNVKLSTISLFPLFGTAVSQIEGVETEGYIVLPDGSGAVINFNNGKFYQEPYVKRLYGQDIALLPYKMQEEQQQINFPIYGMVKGNNAFAAIITSGDSMATINADVSGRIDSYNKVFPSFNLREVESITLGSGFNQYGIDLWTKEKVKTDYTVRYSFLSGDEANYVGIASVYRDYLIEEYSITSSDNTLNTILTTEFIGAYDRKEFFLGIPYYTVDSMTTFDQSLEIIDELNGLGITNMNVLYTGMFKGGISSSINTKFKIDKSLGSNKDYNNFINELETRNINMYPRLKLMTTFEYNKMFDTFRYTSSRIDGDLSRYFKYHLPSKLPYSETPYQTTQDDYVINPSYYQTIFNKFDKGYDEEFIAFDLLGSLISGHYADKNLIYKDTAVKYQTTLLEGMSQNTMLVNPLGYAVPYADYIVDLPTETTLYAILDYQIPLVHLVLSGLVDYSTTSINMASARSYEYNFLKIIETGSNLKYTLSYDDSKELRNTAYNYYISTSYLNWLENIEDSVKKIDQLGIHQGFLVNHMRLENNVFKVTYSHGLEIIINYNLSDVTIDGDVIEAMDYLVLEDD